MKMTCKYLFALLWALMVLSAGCGQRPLSYGTINEAAAKGDLDDVKRHLKRGAALNAIDGDGKTPVMCAAVNGQLDVIRYLVGKGAEVDARDDRGMTPLRYAIAGGRLEVVQYLASNGADVNAEGDDGKTPLWYALENEAPKAAECLIDKSADVSAKGNSGETLLWYSLKKGYLDVATHLWEKGADKSADVGSHFLMLRIRQMQDRCWLEARMASAECEETLKSLLSPGPSASNALARLYAKLGQPEDPRDELSDILNWQEGVEIHGTFIEFMSWHPDLIQMYGNDILGAITSNSIYYGGTDSGRFVTTAFKEARQSPFYVITQNQLADNSYMEYLRNHIGSAIWLPSQQDINEAFGKHVKDVQDGHIQTGADAKNEDGKVSVHGIGDVMAVSGILAETIFQRNKDKRDFYVEESYVMAWMYPYLQPAGLIMKLNSEPIEMTSEIVAADRRYWDSYVERLTDNQEYRQDVRAKMAYSKMRCAIAGIYDYQHMYDEAEYAFKQSIDLYPLNPEANFRLAKMYMNTKRVDAAEELIRAFAWKVPDNKSAQEFLSRIQNARDMNIRQMEFEKKQNNGEPLSADEALELASIYRSSGMQEAYQQLATRLISNTNLPPQHMLALAGQFAKDQRMDALIYALEQYTNRIKDNLDVWLDLAAAYAFVRRDADAILAARTAIELGGEKAREAILRDNRFRALSANGEFKALFPQQNAQPTRAAP